MLGVGHLGMCSTSLFVAVGNVRAASAQLVRGEMRCGGSGLACALIGDECAYLLKSALDGRNMWR